MTRRAPAQFPPGPWPAEMRAGRVAAFLDFETENDLLAAVARGEAPRPTARRGRKNEPVWARAACERWVEQRHGLPSFSGDDRDDIAELLPSP